MTCAIDSRCLDQLGGDAEDELPGQEEAECRCGCGQDYCPIRAVEVQFRHEREERHHDHLHGNHECRQSHQEHSIRPSESEPREGVSTEHVDGDRNHCHHERDGRGVAEPGGDGKCAHDPSEVLESERGRPKMQGTAKQVGPG